MTLFFSIIQEHLKEQQYQLFAASPQTPTPVVDFIVFRGLLRLAYLRILNDNKLYLEERYDNRYHQREILTSITIDFHDPDSFQKLDKWLEEVTDTVYRMVEECARGDR